jgi:hypothetical protein
MAPPILGIHPGQSRILDRQEILAVLLFRGDRPMIGARDDDCSIQDHDLIVCPGMLRIEGHCDPSPQEQCDGLDGRVMRLRVDIEDHVDEVD